MYIGERKAVGLTFLGIETDGNTLYRSDVIHRALLLKVSQCDVAARLVHIDRGDRRRDLLDQGKSLLPVLVVRAVDHLFQGGTAQSSGIPGTHAVFSRSGSVFGSIMVDHTHLVQRPVAENRFPEDLFPFYEGVDPVSGIPGIQPVVAHDKIAVLRDRERVGERRPAHIQIRLVLHGTEFIRNRDVGIIDVYFSVTEFHRIAGQADDPFDKELCLVVRITEDNNVIAFGIAELIGEPVFYLNQTLKFL